MISDLVSFLDRLASSVFAEPDPQVDPWFYDYFAELRDPRGRRRFARALLADLRLAGMDPAGKRVLDAGSGFGLTVLALAHLGARTALGVERFRPMVRTARHLHHRVAPDLPAQFLDASVDRLPLAEASVDFIYCNEALSHFLSPPAFLAEAARVLAPGGRLMVCDGNNALNRRTAAQVHEVWRRFEEGPPGDNVHGHRIEVPYREMRRRAIAAALPDASPQLLDRLAWATFGLHGEEVVTRARRLRAEGTLPDSPPPVDRCPVDPVKGDHIENLIHARQLAADLRRLGFQVKVYAHFGGARSRWLAAANRVLRALTPLTLPYARSVKVVATRTR